MMVNAGQAAAYLVLDKSNYSTGLRTAEQELKTFANNSEKAGNRIQAIGGNISSIGDSMTKGITVPLVGAGTILTKFAMDFETGIAKVSTIADTSEVSMNDMSKAIKNLSSDTGIAATEIANNVYDAISAGQSTGDAVNFVTNSTKLAKAGFAEAGESLDLLTTILNSYGMKSSEVSKVSDILIQTQNKGKVVVSELASSMGKIIPTANSLGINLEQVSAGYALMTSKGINAAETTTYMNGMFNELGKSGTIVSDTVKELTGSSFQELIASGSSVGDILNLLNEYAVENNKSLSDLFGSSEAAKAALVLVNNEGKDFNNMIKEMSNSAGATDAAFKKVSNTTQEKLTKSINKLKNAGIELGTTLLPMVTEGIESITNIADKFNDLDENTKKNIVSIGKMLVVAGPLLSVAGRMTTTIGSLVKGAGMLTNTLGISGTTGAIAGLSSVALPLVATIGVLGTGIYAVHEANDVMNSSIIKSKEEYSLMEKAMAKLIGVEIRSREELEKNSMIYKEFNENISEDFKDSVEAMRMDIVDFNVALNNINFDNVFTEEERKQLEDKVSATVDNAINAINSKNQEMNNSMSNLFSVDGILSDRENEIMFWWSERGTKEIAEAEKLQQEINNIEQLAFNEGRTLTQQEIAAIEERYAQIKQIELLASAKNNEELLYAQKEFETQVATMDAESASNLLIEKRKQADQLLEQKKIEIEVLKAQTMAGYEELSVEDKKKVDETIKMYDESYAELERQNGEFYQSNIEFLKNHNAATLEEIDIYTGKVLTNADRRALEELNKELNKYADLERITESGTYSIYNKTTGMYDEMYIKIDEVTGDIVAVSQFSNNEIGKHLENTVGANEELKESVGALSGEYVLKMNQMAQGTVTSSGQIRSASGDIIGSLQNIETQADGTKRGIINLNGVPIEVRVNKDGTIGALNEINNLKNNVAQDKTVTISFNYQGLQAINYEYINGVAVPRAYATGSDNTLPGIATVAEYGPELIRSKNGMLNLATEKQLSYMQGGEQVYNSRQTEEILRGLSNKNTDESNINQGLNSIVKAIESLKEKIDTAIKQTGNTTNSFGDVVVEGITDVREFIEEISDYKRLRTI